MSCGPCYLVEMFEGSTVWNRVTNICTRMWMTSFTGWLIGQFQIPLTLGLLYTLFLKALMLVFMPPLAPARAPTGDVVEAAAEHTTKVGWGPLERRRWTTWEWVAPLELAYTVIICTSLLIYISHYYFCRMAGLQDYYSKSVSSPLSSTMHHVQGDDLDNIEAFFIRLMETGVAMLIGYNFCREVSHTIGNSQRHLNFITALFRAKILQTRVPDMNSIQLHDLVSRLNPRPLGCSPSVHGANYDRSIAVECEPKLPMTPVHLNSSATMWRDWSCMSLIVFILTLSILLIIIIKLTSSLFVFGV